MVTKEEISDKLNELLKLDMDIDFSRMKKEDLEVLMKVLGEPAALIQLGLKGLRTKAREELLNRPLKEFLNSDVKKRRGGPLGFGILPRILGEKAVGEHQEEDQTKA